MSGFRISTYLVAAMALVVVFGGSQFRSPYLWAWDYSQPRTSIDEVTKRKGIVSLHCRFYLQVVSGVLAVFLRSSRGGIQGCSAHSPRLR